jgi:hypothetical protein
LAPGSRPLPQKVQAVAPKVEEPERSTASAPVPFKLRPSVGTWFTPLLQSVQAVALKGEEPEKSTASAQLAFQLRPAVGTWYAPVQKVQRAQAAPKPAIELPIAAKESPGFSRSPMWRS